MEVTPAHRLGKTSLEFLASSAFHYFIYTVTIRNRRTTVMPEEAGIQETAVSPGYLRSQAGRPTAYRDQVQDCQNVNEFEKRTTRLINTGRK